MFVLAAPAPGPGISVFFKMRAKRGQSGAGMLLSAIKSPAQC